MSTEKTTAKQEEAVPMEQEEKQEEEKEEALIGASDPLVNNDKNNDDGGSDSEDSGKESIESDESSFHPSDYENDSGYDPAKAVEEMMELALDYKQKGNEYFSSNKDTSSDLVRSARSYKMGISVLKPLVRKDEYDDDEEEEKSEKVTEEQRHQAKDLIVTLSNNLSMISLKKGKPKLALDVAKKAIEIDEQLVADDSSSGGAGGTITSNNNNNNTKKNRSKAHYRRAMAYKKLGEFKLARRDLKSAVDCDASNTTALKELHALHTFITKTAEREKAAAKAAFSFGNTKTSVLYEDKYEAERRKQEEEEQKIREAQELEEQRKKEWEDECVQRMSSGKDAISYDDWNKARKKKEKEARKLKKQEDRRKAKELKEEKERLAAEKRAAKKLAAQEKDKDDNNDTELTDKEMAQFRGYKATSQGGKTSYFSRELSKHEEQLIGDISPKRLDVNGDPVDSGPVKLSNSNDTTSTGKGKASKWNAGGSTWEEKDATEWCTSQLQLRLKESIAKNEPLEGIVTSVDIINGEGSVAVAGGRKRYIFDFHCKLDFEIRDSEVDELIAAGCLNLPDINSGNHNDFEIEASWSKEPSDEFAGKARECRSDLSKATRTSVIDFINDFNGHY